MILALILVLSAPAWLPLLGLGFLFIVTLITLPFQMLGALLGSNTK